MVTLRWRLGEAIREQFILLSLMHFLDRAPPAKRFVTMTEIEEIQR